jgi:hypothetical protein
MAACLTTMISFFLFFFALLPDKGVDEDLGALCFACVFLSGQNEGDKLAGHGKIYCS